MSDPSSSSEPDPLGALKLTFLALPLSGKRSTTLLSLVFGVLYALLSCAGTCSSTVPCVQLGPKNSSSSRYGYPLSVR